MVFYKLYEGCEDIKDRYGNLTGTKLPIYGTLKNAMLCISPSNGTYEVEQFGSLKNYDRVMTTSDTTLDINEDSILWIDNQDTSKPHDYIVKKRALWKNSILFAIQQVTVAEKE